MRVAFRGGKEDVPFIKVHLLPSGSQQLIFAPADIVVDNGSSGREGSATASAQPEFERFCRALGVQVSQARFETGVPLT
jgi:hypothetical protein